MAGRLKDLPYPERFLEMRSDDGMLKLRVEVTSGKTVIYDASDDG